jgi:hypothetical protein
MSLFRKIKAKIGSVIRSRYYPHQNSFTKDYITDACRIFELEYGHFNSVSSNEPIDAKGLPIPWFTYPAIDYLDQLYLKDKVMLEWGAGNSSKFFAPKVRQLYSIEHNKDWFDKINKFNLPNHSISHIEEQQYGDLARSLNRKFDIILIDGIKRDVCAGVAIDLLEKGGIIILDNSDRYPDISEKFRDSDLIQVDFHGFGPINTYTWTTSLFISRTFSFKPLLRQPKIPIGGGY